MNDFDKDNYELWKWGIFYYNPKDSDLMVSKRNGSGLTFNFGHKISFVVIGLIIAVILGDLLFSFGIIKI